MSKKNRALASNTQNTLEQLNGSHIITLHTRLSILPPPEELKIYEDIIPGVGKVLVDSYIKQQDHRIKKETIALNGAVKRTARAQWFAFVLAFIAISGGIGLLFLGKNITGFSLLVGAATTLIGVFVYGKKLNTKEYIQRQRETEN